MLYYDPDSDVLQLSNKAKDSIYMQALNGEEDALETIRPYRTTAVSPASYKLWMPGGLAIRIVVSTREYSISYVQPQNVSSQLSGTKRTFSSRQTATATSSANSTAIASTHPVNSISSAGQIIVLRNTRGNEYSLTRLRSIAKTAACDVFEAKHSMFNRVVVVKQLRFAEGKAPRHRGEAWLREYEIHKELKLVCPPYIAELQQFPVDKLKLTCVVLDNHCGAFRWRCSP
jgi:hypothetical protein